MNGQQQHVRDEPLSETRPLFVAAFTTLHETRSFGRSECHMFTTFSQGSDDPANWNGAPHSPIPRRCRRGLSQRLSSRRSTQLPTWEVPRPCIPDATHERLFVERRPRWRRHEQSVERADSGLDESRQAEKGRRRRKEVLHASAQEQGRRAQRDIGRTPRTRKVVERLQFSTTDPGEQFFDRAEAVWKSQQCVVSETSWNWPGETRDHSGRRRTRRRRGRR